MEMFQLTEAFPFVTEKNTVNNVNVVNANKHLYTFNVENNSSWVSIFLFRAVIT